MNYLFYLVVVWEIFAIGFEMAKHGQDRPPLVYNGLAKIFEAVIVITIFYFAIKQGF